VNLVTESPINYVGACFIGSRGAINWRVQPSAPESFKKLTLCRKGDITITSANQYFGDVETSFSVAASRTLRQYATSFQETGYEALSTTDTNVLSGLTVSVPYYSRYIFRSNDPLTRNFGSSFDDSNNDVMRIEAVYNNTTATTDNSILCTDLEMYCAIGADFTFLHFLNVPVYQTGDPVLI
jgi:hypothetical protein